MDATHFVAPQFGIVVRRPGQGRSYPTFIPERVPRSLVLDAETVLALSEADMALGRLAGAGRLLPIPHILVEPYVVREAVASSRIEGTQASLSDVFHAAAGASPAPDSDVREVQNYISALNHGLVLLQQLPVCLRLVREIHAILMEGVRGRERRPGHFRIEPNWIGSPNDQPETAVFVPPPVAEMEAALQDWERFVNDSVRLPALIRCALLHYQFETIHPFLDGNGRLGRLLIVFFLVQSGCLPQPLLYISSYLEQHRREYYSRLQGVRERGEIQEWLQFFLRAVSVQANDAVARAERLCDLRESYRRELASSTSSRAREVVDVIIGHPIVTAKLVEAELTKTKAITHQGALNLIRHLERHGWLHELGTHGRGGRMYWVAREVYEVIAENASTAEEGPAVEQDDMTLSSSN